MAENTYTAAVITVSDKGFRGEREDTSGPALYEILTKEGWQVVYTALVPDERDMIVRELLSCADEKGVALVLTTGGTGFSPRDITPEATLEVVERLCPGIPARLPVPGNGGHSGRHAHHQPAGQPQGFHGKPGRCAQAHPPRRGNAAVRGLRQLRRAGKKEG